MIFIYFWTIFDKLKKIFFEQFSKQNRVYNYRMTWTATTTHHPPVFVEEVRQKTMSYNIMLWMENKERYLWRNETISMMKNKQFLHLEKNKINKPWKKKRIFVMKNKHNLHHEKVMAFPSSKINNKFKPNKDSCVAVKFSFCFN